MLHIGVTIFTVLTALLAAWCALVSHRLARTIYDEAKSDERIIFGPLDHPHSRVAQKEHREAVVGCAVFNKARRKAFINNVVAFGESDEKLEVKWASSIDNLGDPLEPCGLIGIVDSNSFYVARKDGKSIHYLRLEISHSFYDSPCTEIFDPISDWESAATSGSTDATPDAC